MSARKRRMAASQPFDLDAVCRSDAALTAVARRRLRQHGVSDDPALLALAALVEDVDEGLGECGPVFERSNRRRSARVIVAFCGVAVAVAGAGVAAASTGVLPAMHHAGTPHGLHGTDGKHDGLVNPERHAAGRGAHGGDREAPRADAKRQHNGAAHNHPATTAAHAGRRLNVPHAAGGHGPRAEREAGSPTPEGAGGKSGGTNASPTPDPTGTSGRAKTNGKNRTENPGKGRGSAGHGHHPH